MGYMAPSAMPKFFGRKVVDRFAASLAAPNTTASSASRCLCTVQFQQGNVGSQRRAAVKASTCIRAGCRLASYLGSA